MSKSKEAKGSKAAQPWQEVEQERIAGVIRELSSKAPAQVAPYVKQAAPYLAKAVVLVMVAMPYIHIFYTKAKAFISSLPEKAIYASLGFAVCFFGGVFPATIAAVEAWQICGGSEAKACMKELYEEFQKVAEANAADEAKLDSGKQKELEPQELILRKTQLVLKTVDPETLSKGMVGLYTGWIAVLAVLRHQFAKTIMLGERLGQAIYNPASRFEPAIGELVPEEYKRWVPVVLRWACKAFAMSIAWWIQRIVSAVHSAVRGGTLFGRILVEFLHDRKIVVFSPENSYLDEVIGWGIALLGLLFQWSWGFDLPFPLNILLLPIRFLESFIVWSMASGTAM